MASDKYKRKYQKLRDSARGEECTLQIVPYCNNNPETVVLCHIGSSGMGMKAPDWQAVYGCSDCHDVIDHRVKTDFHPLDIRNIMLAAQHKTWARMIDKGLIKI